MVTSISRNLIRSLLAVSLAAIAILVFQSAAKAGAPDHQLKVADAKLIVKGQPAKFDTAKDTFGPGMDGMKLDSDQGTIEVWFKMLTSGADGLSHSLVMVP